jgi:hypothetical protein
MFDDQTVHVPLVIVPTAGIPATTQGQHVDAEQHGRPSRCALACCGSAKLDCRRTVQHQRISQTVPYVIAVEFGINPRTVYSPTCFADPTATAHPPGTREHERDRFGGVLGNDLSLAS